MAQVSASTAQLTTSASAELATPGAAGGRRSTPWRLYLALALGSLTLGGVSILYPSTPSYDPWGWLLWGREIIHLKLLTVGGNSFKPFPVLFTIPFALFGKAQPDLWLALARAGAIFTVAMAFKLAARITLSFMGDAGPAGRQGAARLLAYGPAVLAGTVAALSVLISPQYIRDAALGYSECLGAGMVLLAIDRHLDGKPRQTFVIGFIPALDRPEIWAFWGLYGLYLWRRDPGARKLVLALFALVPCLWFLPELWGSGHFFRGVTRALKPRGNAATFAKCPFCTEFKAGVGLSITRVEIFTGALILGAVITVWRALRGRTAELSAALRDQGRRPEALVIVLAVMAIIWFVEVSAMTQMGFSGNQRYLIIGGALVVVLGGVGWGIVAWKVGELLGRVTGPVPGTAVASLAGTAVFLVFPSWVGGLFPTHKLDHALRYQAELRHDLSAIIDEAGGAEKVRACGTIETENFQKQMVSWYLGVETVETNDDPQGEVDAEPADRDPNVIFQTRATGTARLRPSVPKDVAYTVLHVRTFRLYEHCR
ncbi:MAG TPA: hypothetical protein VG186_11100 [Solirubrobacteraceae bacterium]|nr:hypothetical protein [Solirubrobacteraceae bacterium]